MATDIESGVLEPLADCGGLGATEVGYAFPAQPEPVHQHPFCVRIAPPPLVLLGVSWPQGRLEKVPRLKCARKRLVSPDRADRRCLY